MKKTQLKAQTLCLSEGVLPAVADLWGRVYGVVWGFRSSVWGARAAATMSVMRSIGMVRCQRMDIWNVWNNQTRATVQAKSLEIHTDKSDFKLHPPHHLCQRRWLKECCHQGQGCSAGLLYRPSERPFLTCPLTFLSASWHLSRRGSPSLCH